MASEADAALARVRALCLALPECSERLSHGDPTFFIRGKRSFATFVNNHHGDGRLAIYCAAPEGMQTAAVAGNPERYFVPPYFGHLGWVGLRLEGEPDWDEVAGVIEDAYAVRSQRR